MASNTASKTRWEQRRKPDEVPTPVAVAVSDFCRRARAQASAHEVREALALVPEQDDFRVRSLTDGEPEATPLGPFAVVDILQGTAAQTAAQRQSCGYYELVQAYVQVQQEKAPAPVSAPEPTPGWTPPAPTAAPLFAQEEGKGRKTKGEKPAPTVAEKIAPKKREAVEVETAAGDDVSPFRKRELPAPRGRFTRVDVQKLPLTELRAAAGHQTLSTMMEQHRDRIALARALSRQYQGRAGAPVSMADVTELVEEHKLLPKLQAQEREAVLGAYTEHKGATGRVAWALGVSPAELERLVRAADVKTEVGELRERFKREALAPRNLSYRLDLLGRTKYLSDLGISRKFSDSLTQDLRGLLRSCLGAADTVEALIAVAAKRNGVSEELLARAVEKLDLAQELQKLVSDPHPNSLG